MILLGILLLALYLGLFLYCFNEVLKGKFVYVLYYSVIFFPVYTIFLAINYDSFELPILITLIQYSKEILIFTALMIWIFGQKSLIKRGWDITTLDLLFIGFLGLSLVYLILPIGEASFLNKGIYYKNILLIGLFYFFGRQFKVSFENWNRVFRIIFVMTAIATVIVVLEKLSFTHFHSLFGYAKYNEAIKDIDPAGTYGLTWTFEAQGGQPRFGAFFANPLEFSASMLIGVAAGIVYLLSVKQKPNKYVYIGLLICSFICVVFAYSRATFVAFFLMLIFMAFLLRYYKLITAGVISAVLVALYVIFFASDDVRYFIIDTIKFENSSSVTHIIEWLQAVESMISNPMGIGLATSGNAGGVEKDLQIGGENQYLIYGVQLGFLGLILYVGMLLKGIIQSWKAYRTSEKRTDAIVPFIGASVKFGLLLPLFTANAEAYLYVSLISWWMIGYGESVYQRNQAEKKSLIFDTNVISLQPKV